MHTNNLEISHNRKAIKYTNREKLLRILWGIAKLFFRFSPRIFFGFRASILRLFGAKIGKNVHIYNNATIYMPWNLAIGDWSSIGEHAFIYNLGRITIGSLTTISQRSHLCAGTHDYTMPDLPLLKPPIVIGDQAWVCADAFIGPGVTIGEGAIAAARAVVVKDVEPWNIVGGNPAKFIKKRVISEDGVMTE